MALGEREAELEVSVVSSETRTTNQGAGVAERGDETLRAQMRARTLEMWLALRNQRVKLHLFSGVEVSGVFQTVDAKHENLVIANLDSGVGVVPVARVRWSDVLSITTEADEDRAQAATGCG